MRRAEWKMSGIFFFAKRTPLIHALCVAKSKKPEAPKTDVIIKGLQEAVSRDLIARVRREAYDQGKADGYQLAIAIIDEEVGECQCRMQDSMLVICASCQSEPILTFLIEMRKHVFEA
jgi:hypothetical protein